MKMLSSCETRSIDSYVCNFSRGKRTEPKREERMIRKEERREEKEEKKREKKERREERKRHRD